MKSVFSHKLDLCCKSWLKVDKSWSFSVPKKCSFLATQEVKGRGNSNQLLDKVDHLSKPRTSFIDGQGTHWRYASQKQKHSYKGKDKLYRWTGDSLRIFGNLKPVEVSKNYSNIICSFKKDTLFCRRKRAWLKK